MDIVMVVIIDVSNVATAYFCYFLYFYALLYQPIEKIRIPTGLG